MGYARCTDYAPKDAIPLALLGRQVSSPAGCADAGDRHIARSSTLVKMDSLTLATSWQNHRFCPWPASHVIAETYSHRASAAAIVIGHLICKLLVTAAVFQPQAILGVLVFSSNDAIASTCVFNAATAACKSSIVSVAAGSGLAIGLLPVRGA
jgi:hypothetical protein